MPNNGFFDTIFAQNGDLATVPDSTQVDGSVSYSQGYTTNYELPFSDPNRLRIERTKTNQLFHDVTSALQQYQKNGIPPFITSAMNNNVAFSYMKGIRVLYNNVIYESLTDNNTTTPPSSSWVQYIGNFNYGGTIASASTINLDAVTGQVIDISGTTTINNIILASGSQRIVRFTGSLVLTNSSNLVLLGGVNITTASGDYATFQGYDSGVVRCINYSSASTGYTGSLLAGTGANNLVQLNSQGYLPALDARNLTTNTTAVVNNSNVASNASVYTANPYVGQVGLDVSTTYGQSYTMLPSGIMIQWGYTPSVIGNTLINVTFLTSFPNYCHCVVATTVSGGTGFVNETAIQIDHQYSSYFTICNRTSSGGSVNKKVFWIAIGN